MAGGTNDPLDRRRGGDGGDCYRGIGGRVELTPPETPANCKTSEGSCASNPPPVAIIAWDIDGTLVRFRGANIDPALELAIAMARGIDPATVQFVDEIQGRTASTIISQWGRRQSLDRASIEALVADAQSHLRTIHDRHMVDIAAGYCLLPGCREVMDRIAELGWVQTLVTGNYRVTAKAKLGPFGLDRHIDFDLGAFAEDGDAKADLGPVLRARVAARFAGGESCPVILIGDTPEDVQCAHQAGFGAVAVATGAGHTAEQLADAGPDYLLTDLHDTSHVIDCLAALSQSISTR